MKTHATWLAVCAVCSTAAFILKPTENITTKEIIREVPKEIIKEIPKEVIKEVTKEVPVEVIKEVIKIKEIPAAIPPEYIVAKQYMDSYWNAGSFKDDEVLAEIKNLCVWISIPDDAASQTTQSEIKNKIELELRKIGLRIVDNAHADAAIQFKVSGIWDSTTTRYSYHSELRIIEPVRLLRQNGVFKKQLAPIWFSNYIALAGKNVLTNSIKDDANNLTTSFLNAHLKANQK